MSSEKALPQGSLVLITGINGYIASHVAEKLLGLGYRVRGTARDPKKLDTILKRLRQRNPELSSQLEGVVIPDMTAADAFKEAIKDCAGVIHLASDVSFDPDPNKTVAATVEFQRQALTAASQTPTVKRFVYTSSSIAAVKPTPNKKFHVDSSSWNDEDVKLAWAPPPYTQERSFSVYGASKVESERLAWEFVKGGKAGFALNSVLPNFAIGPIMDPSQPASTAGWAQRTFEGSAEDTEILRNFPPQYYINVEDLALIHVAALLESDVQNERLFAFAGPFTYADFLAAYEKIDPSKGPFPAPLNEDRDLSTVANERALELLKRYGRPGFTDLEVSMKQQLEYRP